MLKKIKQELNKIQPEEIIGALFLIVMGIIIVSFLIYLILSIYIFINLF